MSFRSVIAVFAASVILIAAFEFTAFAAYENTHTNTGNQVADLIAVAKTQVGYAETANNGNKYSSYFGFDNQPWCGYFIAWCARQAGIPTSVIPTTGSSTAFFSVGTYHARSGGYSPQPGDILLYGTYGDSYHVSIVERFDASTKTVYLIDGNWSDQVSSHSTTLSNTEIAGFVTPPYTSSVSELTATNLVTPDVLLVGKSFSISGLISSPNTLKSVSVTIADAQDNVCISQSASPNAKSYDVAGLDAKIPFGSLAAGSYTYTVTATDTVSTKSWMHTFEVVSTVEITVENMLLPSTLAKGNPFSIFGTVSCPEALQSVSISIYNQNGVYQTGGTAAPSATSYDIHGVDNYVSFGKLAVGTYDMVISARSANASASFHYSLSVVEQSATPVFDALNLTQPSCLSAGATASPTGRLFSSHVLSQVTLEVTDTDGNRLLSTSASVNTTGYTVDTLGAALDLSSLTEGTYTYTITAYAAGTKHVWSQPLTVLPTDRLPGDINLDGAVNTLDTILLYSYVAGEITLSDDQLLAAGTSSVNMFAVMALFNFTSGVTSQYP